MIIAVRAPSLGNAFPGGSFSAILLRSLIPLIAIKKGTYILLF